MTEEEFARCQMALGRRIHEHDGVFWEEIRRFYCKPAFIYRPFDPGEARPALKNSLLGHSHQVRTADKGNRTVTFMVLEDRDLRDFGLQRLSANTRSKVRRGLKNCAIDIIADIDHSLERIRTINIEQSERLRSGAGADTSVSRYTDEAEAWRSQVLEDFTRGNREWWGAFVEGSLAAYVRTYQVDGVRVIEQVKADTAYLRVYPVYALYYSILTAAASNAECQRVFNGGLAHESLDSFKQQFLFKPVGYPYYSSYAWVVESAKHLRSIRHGAIRHLRKPVRKNEAP